MNDPKQCIIIGAAGGIGRALAERLAGDRWRLVLAGRRQACLDEVAQALGDAVVGTKAINAQRFEDVEALFAEHPGTTGAVNLAGSILLKPAHATTVVEFDDTIDQNVRTAFALVRAAGRAMRPTGGSVVLISSAAAGVGLPNHEAISAAKGAVEALTRSAAASYANVGIRFNALALGLTDTPMAERLTRNEASLKASAAMHPLGRIGRPDEAARVIELLLDPACGWMTGQVIGLDGGLARVRGR